MRNRALENTVYVITAGAFGMFLRWMQLQLAFDENGLCGPHVFNYFVPLFLIAVAVVFWVRAGQTLGKTRMLPRKYETALSNPGKLYAAGRWLVGAMMVAGGVLLIRGSDVEKQKMLMRIIGGLAIAVGAEFPLYLEFANRGVKPRLRGLLCLMSLLPIVLFGVWLVYIYVCNSINSVIWAFMIELITVSALSLAFFRLAGFAFSQVDPRRTFFWLQYGAFMGIVSLADSRKTSMQIILVAAALMLILADFILLRRVRPKPEGEEEESFDGGIEKL